MFDKILVPLDGSPLSEAVFPWLRVIAEKMSDQPEVTLLRAFEPPSTVYLLPELAVPTTNIFNDDYLGGLIAEYLKNKAEELHPIKVEPWLTMGDPASEILEKSADFGLIIMASHGRGGLGQWLLGSVATKVIRGVTVPVLVINGKSLELHPEKAGRFGKFFIPVDGSEVSQRAFALGCRMARTFGAEVHLYTAVTRLEVASTQALEMNRSAVEHFQELHQTLIDGVEGVSVVSTVKETHDSTEIVQVAEKWGADLIVIASHGHSGFQRWAVGGETERTVHHAACPVMVTH